MSSDLSWYYIHNNMDLKCKSRLKSSGFAKDPTWETCQDCVGLKICNFLLSVYATFFVNIRLSLNDLFV